MQRIAVDGKGDVDYDDEDDDDDDDDDGNNNDSNYYYYYHYYPRYLLYAGYLHLYSWDKPRPWGKSCCSYSGVTVVHGAYIASSCVDSIVSLR